MLKLLRDDPRYKLEAYKFVREGLGYAQDILRMGLDEAHAEKAESHITGQQLCEAIRHYALEQYGYMAKVVLGSWGINRTGDFGEIVYNLIGIGWMKKSDHDRREDFDDVFDFETSLRQEFKITLPVEKGD